MASVRRRIAADRSISIPEPTVVDDPRARVGSASVSSAVTPNAMAPDDLIEQALAVIDRRLRTPGRFMSSARAASEFLRLRLAGLEHEVFMVLFLDAQHRLIAAEEMFRARLARLPCIRARSSRLHSSATQRR